MPRRDELDPALRQLQAESEQLFRSIFEGAAVGMATGLPDGRLLQVNPRFCQMLGYARDELVRKTVDEITHPDDRDTSRDALEVTASRGRQATEYEKRYLHRDGSIVWGHVTAVMLYGDDGQPTCIVGMIQDVTKRKRAEEQLRRSQQALRESEEQFRSIFEHAGAGMATGRPDGTLLQVNPQLCSMLGYSAAELRGRSVLDLTHPEDHPLAVAQLRQALSGGHDKLDAELRYRHKQGHPVWVHLTVVFLRDGEGRVSRMIGLCLDVTERRRAEERILWAQRMEAIGQLAGGVAHDFNNLMTAITGYSDFLYRGMDDDDPRRREVSQIADAARQAAALTEQLLAISHQQVLQSTLVEGQQLVASLTNGMQWLVGDTVRMRFEPDAGSERILVDPERLEKALQCLIDNARDAMPAGGMLTVGTRILRAADVAVAVRQTVDDGGYFVITVHDTGCGIPPPDQAHVFEPFFTTKHRDRGTGLGLATVYGMVRQTGGHVWVESEPGIGSTFFLAFPLQDAVEETHDKRPHAGERETPRKAATIFLVEDDDSIRELCREILEMDGHEVIEAVDGVEALEILERLDRAIDVVLTDVVMPRMGGPELIKRMSVDRPDLKVIFTSGYTRGAITESDSLPEGCSFVGKPFAPDELARAVRKALDD